MQLFLGGSNPNFYHNPMVYTPVVKNADMWSVRIDSITAGGGDDGESVELCAAAAAAGDCFALIDTGAYKIYGPSEGVAKLNR